MKRRLMHTLLLTLLPVLLTAQSFKWIITPVMTIGDNPDAAEEYQLNNPKRVVTDSKGNIYIGDHQELRIKMFDREGRFIRHIGRWGQGPGEFNNVACFCVDAAGDFIVVDRLNKRFTRYSHHTNSHAGVSSKARHTFYLNRQAVIMDIGMP